MSATRIIILSSLVGFLAISSFGVEYERERYDVIVERSPFGEDPTLAQDAAAKDAKSAKEALAAQAAAKRLEKELRLCYLLKSETGEVRAGFQNLQAKQGDPKSVMLMVGENFKGMKLVSIDLENATATLDSNGQPVTFELKKAAAPAQAAKKAPETPQRRFGSGFRRETKKEEPQPELSDEEAQKKREQVREDLRQYQMEVIRAGMPPLPIPLTQDMDDQLVSEGVLPPSE